MIFHRLTPYSQQRCAFRREAKRPETKKGNVDKETNNTPSEAADGVPPGQAVPRPPRVPRPTLFRPLMFTVGVGTLYLPTHFLNRELYFL